jgi:hypothetical protein
VFAAHAAAEHGLVGRILAQRMAGNPGDFLLAWRPWRLW